MLVVSPRLAFSTFLSILAVAAPLSAQNRQVQTFGFVIDHGFALSSKTDANGETISVSSGKLRPLVHNAKIFANQGKGRVTFWNRTVPDTFFNGIGSKAALIVLDFDPMNSNVKAYLSRIETPTGVKTAIGILFQDSNGKITGPAPFVRGTWTMSPGTMSNGTNPDDLVIKGTIVIYQSTPPSLGTGVLNLLPHFANPPFASDATATSMHVVDPNTLMGSFYGETLFGKTRAVRAFSSNLFPALWAHLAVVQTSASEALLVACADLVATTTPKFCTVSGAGSTSQTLAGWGFYAPGATTTSLSIETFLVK